MQVLNNPTDLEIRNTLARPATATSTETKVLVKSIMDNVQQNGDQAILDYTRKYDYPDADSLRVAKVDIAASTVNQILAEAITVAKSNITSFHQSQLQQRTIIETMPGVQCWRKQVPIQRVGIYIPGGTAPLLSTALMLGIPARLAGCPEIALCTPPQSDGKIDATILYIADLLGIEEVYAMGGAQAIAALTYGTETISPVSKIYGPGNSYVTMAKELAQQSGVAIDMPAGPSELLIIADDTANVAFVAADLLSQAEHGTDSQVILLTTSKKVASGVQQEVRCQLADLPRKKIAEAALQHAAILILKDMQQCLHWSNEYAPEHLIINAKNESQLADQVVHAGSVFIGAYSCESVGDYASGTNHTLPTYGYAKAYSGVSVDSFMRQVTYQRVSAAGIRNIGPYVETLAQAEQLEAHRRAVSIRIKTLQS